jgi:hypothetical protein
MGKKQILRSAQDDKLEGQGGTLKGNNIRDED